MLNAPDTVNLLKLCTFVFVSPRDSHPLPEDVSVIGSDLFIRGPLQMHHAGEYVCQASYRKHLATLQFTVEAKPKVLLPGINSFKMIAEVVN